MIEFAYLCSMLFIVIFILYLESTNLKKCPVKIRNFYSIALVLMAVRYASAIASLLTEKQKLVYLIRYFLLVDFIAVPLLGLAAIYIFFRNEERKFNYNYSFMVIIMVVYSMLIYVYKLIINIDSTFGFVVNFKNYLTPSLIYLIMAAIIAVISLVYIDKPYSNKAGMRILMLSLMVTIAEFIMFLGGIKFFPYPMIGQVLMLITTYKAINTFKI